MTGLTDRDLRRIRRFVETPPRQRTPHILTPDEESEGRTNGASTVLEESEGRTNGVSAALEPHDDADAERQSAAETDREPSG